MFFSFAVSVTNYSSSSNIQHTIMLGQTMCIETVPNLMEMYGAGDLLGALKATQEFVNSIHDSIGCDFDFFHLSPPPLPSRSLSLTLIFSFFLCDMFSHMTWVGYESSTRQEYNKDSCKQIILAMAEWVCFPTHRMDV